MTMREFIHGFFSDLSCRPGIWAPTSIELVVGLIALWLALRHRSATLGRSIALACVAIAVVSTVIAWHFENDNYTPLAFAVIAAPAVLGLIALAVPARPDTPSGAV
jgi:peptidoglycan/LPS O-acetylase OafA/YrhL